MSDLEDIIRRIVRDELGALKKPANDAPEAITVAEYARRYSISESTVRIAIREKRLEHVRIGRAVRVPSGARISPAVRDATDRARLRLLGGGRLR